METDQTLIGITEVFRNFQEILIFSVSYENDVLNPSGWINKENIINIYDYFNKSINLLTVCLPRTYLPLSYLSNFIPETFLIIDPTL